MSEYLPPSPNGANGSPPAGHRGPGGRFLPGNKGGPGNPNAAKVARLRSALLKSVSAADMRAIIDRLVADAKAGSVQAAKEVLERTLGKPVEADLLDRIEKLEKLLKEKEQ